MLTRYSEPWLFLLNGDGAGGGGAGGAGSGGSGAGGTGGAGSGDGGGTGGSGAGQGAQGKLFTEDYVKTLRDESAGHRTRAKGYETAVRTALGIAEGTELPQDLGAALTGLKTSGQQAAAADLATLQQMALEGQFTFAATGKIVDPAAAYALAATKGYTFDIDLKAKAITVKGPDGKALADKDGKTLTGIAAMGALADALVTAMPYLKGTGAGPSQVGGTTPPGGSGTQETPQQAADRIAKEREGANTGAKNSFWNRGPKQ